MIDELKKEDQLICVKDMLSGRGKLFSKGGIYTVCCRMHPALEENSYKIYNPVSMSGETMLDIKTINEYFIKYNVTDAFKYRK